MNPIQPNSPTISVVIPTHNRPELLLEAVNSIVQQTHSNWEAIIVDDASSPPAIAPDDPRIRIVRHDSVKGGAACKNTGTALARAKVIAFLDDDDLYTPDYLERALGIFDRNLDVDVIFMGVSWFGNAADYGQRSNDAAMQKVLTDAKGTTIEKGVIRFSDTLIDALLKSVPMGFQRPVVRSTALERIGPYRPDCLLWDCDWAISAALNAHTAHFEVGVYLQRADGQGYSSREDRRIEQMKSDIKTKERFLQDSLQGRYPRDLAPKFRHAASKAWFDLAWNYYQRQERGKAWDALWRSELRQFRLANLKLLPRLLWPGTIR
jgi:glycosyltransferase involved in cell wall biosynthesis